jgi:hypothetical protein
MGLLAALGAAVMLCGCAGTADQTAQTDEPLPSDYRQMIVDNVRSTFFDPYSIRDAGIAAPRSGASILGHVQTVCVRANAKNRMGGYTGQQATAFIFRGGKITLSQGGDLGASICRGAVYDPFPEIEAGYKPPPVAPATSPRRRPKPGA